jgi:predicted TIM-barrel fold metal-dependent hydrolase
VENGSEFLGELLRFLAHTKERLPDYFSEDPVESFREHVWLNPFWEDDITEIIEHMGSDRVILGSDWPHMEGLQTPRDILEEVEGLPSDMQQKILYANTAELNQRRPL